MPGQYAVITGAASGMGREYAKQLTERGFGVVAVDINAAGLEALAAEFPSVVPFSIDLTREDAASQVGLFTRGQGLEVSLLINNAGMIFTSEIAETEPARLRAMMMLHCVTPLMLCREYLPEMTARGSGRILNVSSICSWMHWPAIGMYGNTKNFVRNYSRSLRIECRSTGVSVTTAIFGAVDTPLFGFSEKTRRKMHRWGLMISPEDAVKKALAATLQGRKKIIPGFLNKISPAVAILSDRTLARLYKRFGHLLRG